MFWIGIVGLFLVFASLAIQCVDFIMDGDLVGWAVLGILLILVSAFGTIGTAIHSSITKQPTAQVEACK